MEKPKPPFNLERFAAGFMSVAAAVGFGALGVMAIWDHAVTWPGRNGPVHSSGAAADALGWVLLAAAAGFLAHLAMLIRPGRAGAKWVLCIFLVWGAAIVGYYAMKYGFRAGT